eukprot:4327542-Prorocentrum_lima.AAC.1
MLADLVDDCALFLRHWDEVSQMPSYVPLLRVPATRRVHSVADVEATQHVLEAHGGLSLAGEGAAICGR